MSYAPKSGKWSYKKTTKSKNDELSKDLDKTVKQWKEQGFVKYDGKYEDVPTKTYIKFITTRNGEPQARQGGIIIQKNDDVGYFQLLNTVFGRAFPVQWSDVKPKKGASNLVGIYMKPPGTKTKAKPAPQQVEEDDTQAQVNPDEVLKKLYYDDGNIVGRDKLYAIAQEKGFDITRDEVEEWLNKQEAHQTYKKQYGNIKGVQPVKAGEPDALWEMDLAQLEDKILLNVVDVYSRFAYALIIPGKTNAELIEGMKKILDSRPFQNRKVRAILSDNGSEFSGAETKKFFKDLKIKQIFSQPSTPQTQGIVERFNGTFKTLLRKNIETNKKKLTQTLLNKVLQNYNDTPHSSTGKTPYNLYTNSDVKPKENKDISENLDMNNKDDLKVGDEVRLILLRSKFEKSPKNWTDEIFTVDKIIKSKNVALPIKYKLKDGKGEVLKGVMTRSQLQKVVKEIDSPVKTLVYREKKKGKLYYLVEFENGYSDWVSRVNLLKTNKDLVETFEKKVKEEKKEP